MKKKLAWKRELSDVMDNPDYIEEKVKAMLSELKREHPNTAYLREKLMQMNEWTHEIDLAHKRAKLKEVV